MFAVTRSTKEEPDFAPAASPRLPRSTSPWPPCGKCEPAREFPDQPNDQGRTAPGPHPSGSSRSVIKGRMTPVPHVLLSVTLTGPDHLTVLARPGLVGAACHPPRRLPDQAAPSSITPAASEAKAKVSHLHSTHSASRRTAMVTDRPGGTLELEADHRRHAVVEQSIAELKSAGLAHLPSGKFMANAAWLALAVIAHNLGRAVGALAGADLARATIATLRRRLFTVPGRLVRTARRLHLRLPRNWPWATAFLTALDSIHALPMRC